MFKKIPKEDRQRYRKEQRFFLSLATAFMGWMFLFTIPLVIAYVTAWSYIPALQPDKLEASWWLLLLDVASTAVLISIITHLVLKKRVKNGEFVLAEGITFKYFRNKVFIHCVWASLLILYSMSFLLTLTETLTHLKTGTSVMSIVIPAYVFMYICQRYHKKYYTIPAFLPVDEHSTPFNPVMSKEEKLARVEVHIQQHVNGRKASLALQRVHKHINKKNNGALVDAACKDSHIEQIASFFIKIPTLILAVPFGWIMMEFLLVFITFVQTSNFILALIALPLLHGIMFVVFSQVQSTKVKSLVKSFQASNI